MTIVITSKLDGFRRCGIAHPSKPTQYPDNFFTGAQLDALDKEPQLILAYAPDEFDQVQDRLNETESQTVPPQASDTVPDAQPQAPKAITAPVVAPVASTINTTLDDELPGVSVPGATDINSVGGDGLLIDNQDSLAADEGKDDQPDADQQEAAKTTAKPEKAKAGKAKDAAK